MKCFFLILGILVGFSSCALKEKPSSIIPKEKMTEIMSEVFVVEMYYQKKHASPFVYRKVLKKALLKTFQKHRVTSKEYSQSFDFYAQDYAAFKEMNLEIIQRYNESLLKQ
ncbi:MAG: DUF4296 domain-containing protein [Flavobacteriia bacterium]|jgi:hypothetical protein|nr:DUF4296 domain-containing protein [Flavobacteriia bacterium]NBV91002.1 DUF4296 domain-containing protein [Flavobacteriia bacterium]NBY41574.1 DUF4296 domain-containing protein [Flavobacteriia bacterium]